MIAIMGERSIMPVFGMTRRNGLMIGSVTRWSICTSVLDWSTGNQLSNDRAMIAHVRMFSQVKVSWATYGLMVLPRETRGYRPSGYQTGEKAEEGHWSAAIRTTSSMT